MVKRILPDESSIADFALAGLDQPLHFADGLARHDDAGHAGCALRQRQFDLREAMAVGRHRAQRRAFGGARGVQIDAVEIIARLFGGDGELGLVDQPLEVGGGKRERVRHVAGGEIGKIALRQRLQREARAPGADRQHRAVAGALDHDLRAFGQLAHDLVEHVRRHRGGAAGRDLGGDRIGDFEIEIGRLQAELALVGLDQHVGEDRDGIAALDHAMHVAQRLQQFGALDGHFHGKTRFGALK